VVRTRHLHTIPTYLAPPCPDGAFSFKELAIWGHQTQRKILIKWKELLNGDCPKRDAHSLHERCDLVCPDVDLRCRAGSDPQPARKADVQLISGQASGCGALASLNAGITSFANRSSCSKATFSGADRQIFEK
jgi:hypothetical protein